MSATSSHLCSNCSALLGDCFALRKSLLVLTSFSITSVLLIMPPSVLVLHLGFQRWRQRRSVSTATAANHSDIFTYHMVVMEMLTVLFCLWFCASVGTDLGISISITILVFTLFFCFWSTKILFHALTSVELYLAVVHPVAYRSLRSKGGSRVRTASVAGVWLLCLVWEVVVYLTSAALIAIYLSFLVSSLAVVCFCCVSVLRALRRPSPGEAVGDRERVDQMKRRAFNTVATIMAALWLCLGGTLLCNFVSSSQMLGSEDKCAVLSASAWFSLPSSSVLPVLYLHRAEKLPCCKYR